MEKSTAIFCVAAVALLTACASPREQATLYDFGLLSARAPTLSADRLAALPPISVAEPIAPSALDTQRMYFRLLYANDQQPRAYAGSRWSMPPAQLFVQRLKADMARAGLKIVSASTGAAHVPLLRIEADEFMQVFERPGQSSARIMLRAAVLDGRTLLAQKTFSRQVPAPTADAAGGAHALAAASDAVIADITEWLSSLNLPQP